MTDKELRKLRRSELLEMMIQQKKTVAAVEKELDDTRAELEELKETYERLRKKLDDKDAKIHELRAELAQALDKREILNGEAESIAQVTERLNEAVLAAGRASTLFEAAVANLSRRSPAPESTHEKT